ncbi:AI-2E family transporter [Nocardioides perillae]|uniref:Putative PurR-regulated permease PerM n=1 Tax=Nocardioides perillae TaxID=1119534 RepID=A0A7Y9RZ47_9ACTN|nr:putative PurR-regulated permease PerM [Nocardioides perillae]
MTPPEPRREREEERLSERITQQLAAQWAVLRAERRAEREAERAADLRALAVRGGRSNFDRAQVPWAVDLVAAWAWRALVIGAALLALLWLLAYFAVVTLPVAIALLLAALASPLAERLRLVGVPRGLAAGLVVALGIAVVAAMLTFVGQQVAQGFTDLANQVVAGLEQVRTWLKTGPLDASDSQINGYLEQVQRSITASVDDGSAMSSVTQLGSALGHVVAGLFIVLFSVFFFLADGARIWAWCVRLAPRAARERLDSSGQVAWISLTQFVRATVLVALVDAVGVVVVAALLGVPLVLALGVLVFLGAFVPLIGATLAGGVAVLVALVDQGPVTALLMLGGVVLVQQLESHVLQPFLMGRFVSVHPLGVIIAIACGILVAGVAGALVAVPLVAAGNAVAQHLAAHTAVGDDAEDSLRNDLPGPPAAERPGPPPEPEDVEAARAAGLPEPLVDPREEEQQ